MTHVERKMKAYERALVEIVRMGDYTFKPHHFAEFAQRVLNKQQAMDGKDAP